MLNHCQVDLQFVPKQIYLLMFSTSLIFGQHELISIKVYCCISYYVKICLHGTGLTNLGFTLQRSLRDIAELYGSELSLQGVQEFRSCSDIKTISKICFKAAGISTVLIDDGLMLDKMLNIEQHRDILPFVARILRIERLAEDILDEVRLSC